MCSYQLARLNLLFFSVYNYCVLLAGVRKILREAARKPSLAKKTGVAALLWHIMRGTSSKFHSRADRVLHLLIDDSTLSIGDKFDQGEL